jgi:RNA binding exosome subunit
VKQEATMTTITFESFREVTGWIRPGKDHGCRPVEVVPGLWTAHYDDIDSPAKLFAVSRNITLVVNSAVKQCPSRTGFYGDRVRVLEVDIEDDPDERKFFDQGKEAWQSKYRDPSVPAYLRCAGNMLVFFDSVADEVQATLNSGSEVLIHCKASLSRSPALVIAYLMKYHTMDLLQARKLLKGKFDATWPCDRFAYDLVEYQRRLKKPYRLSKTQLAVTVVASSALGALLAGASTLSTTANVEL